MKLEEVSIDETEVTMLREVKVSEQAFPLARPLMVRIVAMASSEVRWNRQCDSSSVDRFGPCMPSSR